MQFSQDCLFWDAYLGETNNIYSLVGKWRKLEGRDSPQHYLPIVPTSLGLV